MASTPAFEHYLQSYGDLLFDLSQSLLEDEHQATSTFQSILKEIQYEKKWNSFTVHERAWVLKLACARLLASYHRNNPGLSAEEQIEIDSAKNVTNRLSRFPSFFKRLSPEDQLILLLRDKYGLPYSEVASALSIPEGSLKIRRQQALGTLEEWVWGQQ